ncbi:MAG TPA: hypothetical protein VF509_14385 [Sphingobium sp.]
MVAIGAALVFAIAFALAVGTMAYMFATYRDKMIAALLYQPEPEPEPAPVYAVSVQRKRQAPTAARAPSAMAMAA